MRQFNDVVVRQGALRGVNTPRSARYPFMAKVLVAYSGNNTCDLQTPDGVTIRSIPVMTVAGIVDGKVWGTVDLPSENDWVIVDFMGDSEGHMVVVGTIVPFMAREFRGDAVNSSGKTHTKKLLEVGKKKTYRAILKSGTTLEVSEDGTVILETPSGSLVRLKESDGKIEITASGDEIDLNGSTKSLVKFDELKTAIQSLVSTYNTHSHPTAPGGPVSPPTQQQTLSMDSSEATKVKTS